MIPQNYNRSTNVAMEHNVWRLYAGRYIAWVLHTVELDIMPGYVRPLGLAQNRLLYVVFFVLRSILNFKF